MANEEHMRILRSGVEAWNKWREKNPEVTPDLSHSNLNDVDLRGADLRHADLLGASLVRANVTGGNMSTATLDGAFLNYADLTDVTVSYCSFGGTSLQSVKGLSTLFHIGPSSIGVDTLEMTAAELAKHPSDEGQQEIETFLQYAGVADEYIQFFRSRIGQPIQFYSAFISYSTKDQEFADRLYADLRQKGIRGWLATEDLKIGDKFRNRINDAIRIHDKLMVILSEHSLRSGWVEEEVEAAFERECRDGTTVLFPIRLDEAVMDSNAAWAASIRRIRHIGDFRRWKNHDEYQRSLARLIRDLQADAAPMAR